MERFMNTTSQSIDKNKINIINDASFLKGNRVVIYYDREIKLVFEILAVSSMKWDFLLAESHIPIFFADIRMLEKKIKIESDNEFVMECHIGEKNFYKVIKNTYDIFSLTALENIFTRDDLNNLSGMSIIMCGSSSCPPCCRAMQHIPSMKRRYPKVQFKKVDYDVADRELIEFLKPKLIPMFYVFTNKSSMIMDTYQNSDYIALSVKFEHWIEKFISYSVFDADDF